MAIDTVGLRSPYILEEDAMKIESQCKRVEGVDLKTGEILYTITTASLEGSYDSRISVRVMNETIFAPSGELERKFYIKLEGSVHKALMGHNIYGGPTRFRESIYWLIDHIQNLLEIDLPPADQWQVMKIDEAQIFELPSFEAVEEYFRGLVVVDYSRRKVRRYGFETVYVTGTTTTLKLYHKGPEFHNHDSKKLAKIIDSKTLFELKMKAHKIIRVECSIKAKKLKYDFGHQPTVNEITDDYIRTKFEKEVARLLKEGASDMKIVRDAQEVEKRLYSVYGSNLAGRLLGTWFRLSSMGEDYVKKNIPKRTFYRQRKQLKDAGVSWNNTDVVLKDAKTSLVPEGFSPVLTDPRIVLGESPEVIKLLLPYRKKVQELKQAQ